MIQINLFSELDDTASNFAKLASAVSELGGCINQATHYPKERRYTVHIEGVTPQDLQDSDARHLDYDVINA